MSRDNVTVPENILNVAPEAFKAAAARVAFVAFHHGCPLGRLCVICHLVCLQVDQDICGGHLEKVVVCTPQQPLSLRSCCPVDRLDRLDLKWLDYGLDRHEYFSSLDFAAPPERRGQ